MKAERIQKVLANIGIGSRREIERWIEAGEILVNNKQAQLGDRISAKDKVVVKGKLIRLAPTTYKKPSLPRVLIYHKPTGQISTTQDPQNRPTVFAALPKLYRSRWIVIGRLDFNTSGLLLFTDNGALANHLMHPSSQIEREYAVRILGEAKPEVITQLQAGIILEDGPARFEKIVYAGGTGANQWYHVILSEGRNREVRRLWEAQGLTVSRLIRVRYGNLKLPARLRSGHYQELKDKALLKFLQEVKFLKSKN